MSMTRLSCFCSSLIWRVYASSLEVSSVALVAPTPIPPGALTRILPSAVSEVASPPVADLASLLAWIRSAHRSASGLFREMPLMGVVAMLAPAAKLDFGVSTSTAFWRQT
ncbi:hypothetical protein G6F22_021821 [Rhizopus arrhizus]|nr:hypothetical protein G6F22_021821 [Rhizopus arrhizus]KAG1253059.1 hypothetical protein G6F65_017639 [Rhizopus arrhizus]